GRAHTPCCPQRDSEARKRSNSARPKLSCSTLLHREKPIHSRVFEFLERATRPMDLQHSYRIVFAESEMCDAVARARIAYRGADAVPLFESRSAHHPDQRSDAIPITPVAHQPH